MNRIFQSFRIAESLLTLDYVSIDDGLRRLVNRDAKKVDRVSVSAAVCLIVVANGASARFPLVIAANRDEDYDRPTRAAHFWEDAPNILGGRDALHGGSWLAVTRTGR